MEAETKVLDQGSKTKGETAKVVDLLAVDRKVGRYELIHRLGHGGMATVYLGRATGRAGFERLVAVKVIHPHLANEPEFVEMFLDEARIAARIHHPHVVAIHDVGEDDGVFYMVMEYVEGDTLASLVRQLRKDGRLLPLSAVLQIAADACEGLAAAHDLVDSDEKPLHLVHRDVSPHNLLVGADGRVKVVDFGIMKAVGKRSSTLTGQLRGKLAYMSPEQARGKPIDHRTDIFALGAVLWELLAGRRLFDTDHESETLERVLACDVPDIATIRDDLPAPVTKLLSRALATDKGERFDSAKEMLREVRGLLRGLAADVDPRHDLSVEVERYFAQRIEYIRAAIRGRAIEPRVARPTDRELFEAVQSGSGSDPLRDDEISKTPALGSSVRAATQVLVAEDGEPEPSANTHTNTNTLTTSQVAAGARTLSRWLLLPLIGAAIAIAIIGWPKDEPEPKPAPPVVDETPTPANTRPEPPTPVPPPSEPAAPATVKWNFNTDPQGALVTIGGTQYTDPTPMSVELPHGEEPLDVLIEREGFAPHRARLAPNETLNLQYTLKKSGPTFATKFHPDAKSSPGKTGSGKSGKRGKSGTAPTKPPAETKDEFGDVPDWVKSPSDDAKTP
jgi:serine/threonine-protein kinase